MAPFALAFVLWLADIRGHIPRFDDFRPAPAAPTPLASQLLRILALTAAIMIALSLAVWGTVWLSIRLL